MRLTSVSRERRSLTVLVAAMVWAGGAGPATADTFSFTGTEQTYAAPAGATLVHVVAIGAPGGAAGGGAGYFPPLASGAIVSADLPVSSGQVLYVEVGGPGLGPSTIQTTGGFNGGGSGGVVFTVGWGPGGGGASDVRTLPRAQSGSIASRLIVAAGGGGSSDDGGAGGPAGEASGGQAGTATMGGAGGLSNCVPKVGDGSSGGLGEGGMGGLGATGPINLGQPFIPMGPYPSGGGGGGGYYGGGGGGGNQTAVSVPVCLGSAGGGGGGSSFVDPQAQNASVGVSTTTAPEVVITIPVPAASVLPQVSGKPVPGKTLTDTGASWSNQPTAVSYQWLRCDATGSGCHSIAAATGPTYQLAEADVGATLRVQETASNRYGVSSPAVSAPTAMVQFPPPIVKTIAATGVRSTAATLHARVDPNGNAVTVSFQYSRRANMTRAKATRNVRLPDGTSPVRVSAVIAHLAKHTLYYYRVTVTEIQQRSSVRGHVLSFKTAQG